ncbi:MAG: hypothetical protein M3247_04310 [Thermoproteota archaeon]|nr:hypothetical protein [Thermoproteota archaeon]
MMTDPFTIFKDKGSTAIAAMILGVVLLLPASLGFGGTIVQNAFGQFNVPPLPGERDTTTGDTTTGDTTTGGTAGGTAAVPQGVENGLSFLVRGFIGSTLPTQGGGNADTHVVTGRFRIFANESLIHRVVAEMYLAPTDGSAFNNVTIEETAPHRFELTPGANGTTGTNTPTGPVPPFTSNIMARIYVNSNIPAIDDVPMTVSIRGQVLSIQGITIDQSRITDAGVRDVLAALNGQSIYGTIPR